jgi:hypothetical protein
VGSYLFRCLGRKKVSKISQLFVLLRAPIKPVEGIVGRRGRPA